MKYGETIKKIRIGKGYSKKEVYTGVISNTFSYYFEKGDNTITVEKLETILKNLNLTFDEFILIHNNYNYAPYNNLYREISIGLNSNILILRRIYLANWDSRDMQKKVIASLSYSLFLLNTNQPLKHKTVLFLKNYLVSIKSPTIIDLELFQYALIIFNDQIDYLTSIIPPFEQSLKDYHQSRFQKESIERIIQEIFINYTQVLLTNSRVEEANLWQTHFLDIFEEVDSFEVTLHFKCGKLLVDLFDDNEQIRHTAQTNFDNILNFLDFYFETDLNLMSIYVYMKNLSVKYLNNFSDN